MKRSRFNKMTLVMVIVFGSVAYAQQSTIADSTLRQLYKLYEKADYVGTELGARRALELQSMNDSLRIEIEKLLAFSLVAQGNVKAALDHFEQILIIDQDFALDPVLTSPKILSVFEKAKHQFTETVKKQNQQTLIYRPIKTPSVSYRVLLFPGLEQLHQQRTTTGYLLLGGGTATLVTTIYASIERSRYRKQYLDARSVEAAQSLYKSYNYFHKMRAYAAYTFIAVYLYSEIDAFLCLPDESDVGIRVSENSNVYSLTVAIRF